MSGPARMKGAHEVPPMRPALTGRPAAAQALERRYSSTVSGELSP